MDFWIIDLDRFELFQNRLSESDGIRTLLKVHVVCKLFWCNHNFFLNTKTETPMPTKSKSIIGFEVIEADETVPATEPVNAAALDDPVGIWADGFVGAVEITEAIVPVVIFWWVTWRPVNLLNCKKQSGVYVLIKNAGVIGCTRCITILHCPHIPIPENTANGMTRIRSRMGLKAAIICALFCGFPSPHLATDWR